MRRIFSKKLLIGTVIFSTLTFGSMMQLAYAGIFTSIYNGIMKVVSASVTVAEVINELEAPPLEETQVKSDAYDESGGSSAEAENMGTTMSQDIEKESDMITDPMTLSLRQVAQPNEYVEGGKTYSTTSATSVTSSPVLSGKQEQAAKDVATNATQTQAIAPNDGWKGTPSALAYESHHKTVDSAGSYARATTVNSVADRRASQSTGGGSNYNTKQTASTAPLLPSKKSSSPIVNGVNQLMVSSKTVSVGLTDVSQSTSSLNNQMGVLNSTALRTENDTTGRQLRANAEASQPGAEADKKPAGG